MKEENKKRINKLIIPLTKKSLAILGAVTISTTGLASCKSEKKNDSSDLTTSISSTSSELEVSSEILSSEIVSSEEQNSKVNSSTASSSKTSKTSSKKPTTPNSNNIASSNNPSTNVPATPSESLTPQPTMPSTLTASNINNVEVFKHFAMSFSDESFPSTPLYSYGYYYEDKLYKTAGDEEFQLILALFNYEYVDTSLLKELFGNCDEETFKRYSVFFSTTQNIVRDKKIIYNFDKYLIDKELGAYLKKFNEEYLKLANGEDNNFRQLAIDYFTDSSSKYNYENTSTFVRYYMYSFTYNLGYDYIFSAKLDEKIVAVTKEVKYNYDNQIIEMYSEINSKSKTLN